MNLTIFSGRTPHGVRGLKSIRLNGISSENRRTPHGVRGLKFINMDGESLLYMSHPSRGAWIEILRLVSSDSSRSVAPLTGCVD